MDISSNTPKVHGCVLRANPVTISHFLCVPHYYWGVGRPGSVSDPGPDLSTKWISPQMHKKYTVVYSELIRSLLATSYTSLTIIGASDGRSGYRGQHPPPRLAHRPGWQCYLYVGYRTTLADIYVISPGETGGSDSGSSPIWTHSMDEIPQGNYILFNIMFL